MLNELFISSAMAQEAGASSQVSISSFVPLILIFAIFYFFIIRPQSKKFKEHQDLVSNLKIGNLVILTSGIFGKITAIAKDNSTIDVEIADNVIIKVQKNNVSDLVKEEKATKKANKNSKKTNKTKK